MLDERHRTRKFPLKKPTDFLLKGLVFGTDGRAYSPWLSSLRNNRRYAYYVPQSKIAGGAASSDLPRCPAGELETVVIQHLRSQLRSPASLLEHFPQSLLRHPRFDEAAVLALLTNLDSVWDMLFYDARRGLVQTLIQRVTVGADKLSISLDMDGISRVVLDMLKGIPLKTSVT